MPDYGFTEQLEARSEALAYQRPEPVDPLKAAFTKELGRLLDAKTECQRVLDRAGVVEPGDAGGVVDRDGRTSGDAVGRFAGLVLMAGLMALPVVAQTVESGALLRAQALDVGRRVSSSEPAHLLSVKRSTGLLASQAFLLAGAAVDVRSSYGLIERNPFLGRGDFGHRQAVLSLGITAALTFAEGPIVRRHPEMRKPFTVLNYIVGSIRFGVGFRNSRIR